jgi:hypothetical protein
MEEVITLLFESTLNGNMNNSPQQNDRFYEHGYDVRLRRAAPTEASLSITPLTKAATPFSSATIYGPFCQFSNTLPYKIPLRAEANAARWSVTVPDVCYWTPNLPMQYRLTLQLADGQALNTWISLKLLGVRGVDLVLDDTRYVLRGYSNVGLELGATDDTKWQELREQRALLIMKDLDLSVVERAGWVGIPILWDARGIPLQPSDLVMARAQAAVVGIIAPSAAVGNPTMQQAANELLWIVPASEEKGLVELVDERTQVVLLAEANASMTLSSQRPTIISGQFTGNPSLAERRKLCDELQAQTAELGSAAGYLLL